MTAIEHSIIGVLRDFMEEFVIQQNRIPNGRDLGAIDAKIFGRGLPLEIYAALKFFSWYSLAPLKHDGNSENRFNKIISQEKPDQKEALKAAYDLLVAHGVIHNDTRRKTVMAYFDSLKTLDTQEAPEYSLDKQQ